MYRYFEVQIKTPGSVRVGWVRPSMHPSVGLGEDEESFAFDGCLVSLLKMPASHLQSSHAPSFDHLSLLLPILLLHLSLTLCHCRMHRGGSSTSPLYPSATPGRLETSLAACWTLTPGQCVSDGGSSGDCDVQVFNCPLPCSV